MHDEHRYDQCRNLGGMFDFLVHFGVWSKLQMAIKCKNIINILYCTISNCSACHGSQAPLTAPKLVIVTGHIDLGRL